LRSRHDPGQPSGGPPRHRRRASWYERRPAQRAAPLLPPGGLGTAWKIATFSHPGTAEMARRTDESCEEKSEFAHGCCVAAVHGIYAWHTTQNPSAICWQISTMAVQWQYNGGNGSVMAVQLKFVFASYSHRIGTIWHYIGTILALYWHYIGTILALLGRNGSTIPAITIAPLCLK
jgi:hypothetical protein